MYYKLNCLVTITTKDNQVIKFNSLNNVEIENSIDKIGSTAKIKIPTSARLMYADNKTVSVQTNKQFSRGDKIKIELGYNDNLVEEFQGYIYKLNLTTPLEIECEGYEFLLRDKIKTKTFALTTLKEVLNYIIEGKNLSLDGNIPNIELKPFVIPANLTRLDVLQQLKEKYFSTIFFDKDKVYIGLDFIKYKGTVKYKIGYNTIKQDELKYQYAEDVELRVKAISINKNNTKIEAEIGDKDGESRTLYFYNIKSKADLKKVAQAEINKYKFTGYTGKITTFLEPFAIPGMIANIVDDKYTERSGKYEIRSVNVTFGTNGARRIIEIGKTVS